VLIVEQNLVGILAAMWPRDNMTSTTNSGGSKGGMPPPPRWRPGINSKPIQLSLVKSSMLKSALLLNSQFSTAVATCNDSTMKQQIEVLVHLTSFMSL